LHLWDVAAGKELRRWQSAEVVEGTRLSPDGRLLASVGADIRLWDAQTGKERHAFKRSKAPARVAFSVDGKTLAAASWDRLRWWDVTTGKKLGEVELKYPKLEEVLLVFSPTGKLLVGNPDAFDLWDLARKQKVLTLMLDGKPFACLSFSPDGQTL